ncbi:hypothetical protein GCM10008955_15230 [Deinococcus malanensis]|uniref:N-acetyltransferase domain-containing protein n=2 Tax=Deinococcus malanensis TaxID=1706855 RepID=A0ABQ2ESJ2_9DEIO|nr:hypothetical protein [Deinococcus malanensis]GGK22706.1 hypothetical protein GCM10008955_15230 [Deinococcus malanensis]
MTFTLSPVRPEELPPVFAALYGAPQEAVAWMADELEAAWIAHGEEGEVLGAVGLRPSPAHGSEVVGGALFGLHALQVASALALQARQDGGPVYAFADGGMLSARALEAAGYREVAAYRLLAGPTPQEAAALPGGLTLHSLSEVPDIAIRLDALGTYEDRIGHHAVIPQAAADDAGGFDPTLSLIALDEQGHAAGICRAAPEEGYVRIDAPGVRQDLRATSLRAALLLGVCALARDRGFEHVSVESWGDTAEELAADLQLGLGVEIENPIYAAG